MKNLRTVRSVFVLVTSFAALALTSCSLIKTGPTEDEIIRKQKVDQLQASAKLEYDKGTSGGYSGAYTLSRSAFELDNTDIGAEMLMGWSLLQLRRYEDFDMPQTKIFTRGARTIFKDILAYSPHEFRARQGLATIAFNEHYTFNRKVKVFLTINRKLREFKTMLEKVPSNPEQANEHPAVLDFEQAWRSAGGFQESYEASYHSKVPLWSDDRKPDATLSGPTWRSWSDETDVLNQIPYFVHRGKTALARERLDTLLTWNEARGEYWESRALERLQNSLTLFEDMNRTREGLYHYVLRDIGLCHVALGTFFLQKEIDRASEFVKTQDGWDRIPEHKRQEALLAFIQDEKRFPSVRRADMNKEFGLAVKWLQDFISEDLKYDRKREELIAEKSEDYARNVDRDAVTEDFFRLYVQGIGENMRAQQDARKGIILQTLTLLIYPQFGNVDYDQALILANQLQNTDIQDPLPFMIRGIIYERSEAWEDAAREYDLFLQKASIATDSLRRNFALEHKLDCERRARFD